MIVPHGAAPSAPANNINERTKPIFYDAEKVRWRRTRRVLEISGALLTLLLVYFFITIAGSVELPSSLYCRTRTPLYHAVKKKNLKPVVLREGRHKRVANIGQVPAAYDPLRAAFFVSWDPNSLASLKKHYKDIDLLMPEQLHAVSAGRRDYGCGLRAEPNGKSFAGGSNLTRLKQDKLHQWMRSITPPLELPMMGLLNNYDGTIWRSKELAEMLANSAHAQTLVTDVAEYAVQGAPGRDRGGLRRSAAEEPAEFPRIHRRAGAGAARGGTEADDCPASARR